MKTRYIYGVIDENGIFYDVSNTEHGAKMYATKNNYKKIGYRNVNSYNPITSHEKNDKNIWVSLPF